MSAAVAGRAAVDSDDESAGAAGPTPAAGSDGDVAAAADESAGGGSAGAPAEPARDEPESAAGGRLLRVDWVATGIFAALTTVATVLPGDTARPVAFVHCALFAVGIGAFLWAYWIAVQRSRTDAVSIGGVYFLAGDVAPEPVVRSFRWALGVQVVGAIVAASLRPYTAVAFAVLTPMLGLGLMGLWGARHATFPPRQ